MNFCQIIEEEYQKWLDTDGKELKSIYPNRFPSCYIKPVLNAMARVKTESQPDALTVTEGAWLTDEIKARAINIWNSHKCVDDHKRVDAVKYLQDAAEKAGYKTGIGKCLKIMHDLINIA
jgi:hypothetical protein